MATWLTETLIFYKNFLQITAVVLAISTGVVMYLLYRVERELDRRRSAEAKILDQEITTSKRDVEAARRDAEALRERLKSRDIPTDKREGVLTILRRAKGTVDIVYPSDTEAEVFAKRIGALIREAGWEAKEEGAMSFGPIIGLRLEINDKTSPPSYASVLREALDFGFQNVMFQTSPNVDAGKLRLTVGSKPFE